MPRRSPNARRGEAERGLLSIGALSAATAIPVDTIRTWERRYGFPVAERKPSGHRVYPLSTVSRLNRMVQAIARGHRAAEVLPASQGDLEAMLAALPRTVPEGTPRDRASLPLVLLPPSDPADLIEAVGAFDSERLKRAFQADWARFGPLEFLEHRATPFLSAVGDGWANGSLDVRHEHFASACLGDFLRAVRSPLDDRATGPIVALATLPGELHGLGLQMCALVFALAGWRALILGVDTPAAQIAALAREAPIAAVAVSCVQPHGRRAGAALLALRRQLPRRIPLIVGGSSAPHTSSERGIEFMPDLSALDRWLHQRPAA